MGARQSIQTDLERRPRSNSAIETGVEVHGSSGRRHVPTRYAPRSRAVAGSQTSEDLDEEADEAISPGPSSSHTVHGAPGLRFSFRPMARTSFLQALAGSGAGAASSAPAGSGGSRSRDRHSVSVLHLIGQDLKCPICHKKVPSEDAEVHLVMCFTRPKIAYNDDILTDEKGECAICLDEMSVGETIARLPCLCIYHKNCIDEWFKRKNCCPEHPGDE